MKEDRKRWRERMRRRRGRCGCNQKKGGGVLCVIGGKVGRRENERE